MGGVFVVETLSVMLQVAWFKYNQKTIRRGPAHFSHGPVAPSFRTSPVWKETQVVVRFWIISMMLVLVGLASLKLR